MSKNIGIDLGKEHIKLIYIDDKRLDLKVEDSEVYELEYENDKEYFDLVEECIKEFTKKNKIKLAKLHFSISPDAPFVLYDFFNIPKLKDREITKALKYEMQNVVSYNINDYSLKWVVLDEDVLADEIQVFVVGIKNKLIEYISNLSKFTWIIGSIELQPLELAKLFSDTISILDIGKKNIRAYLYEDNKLVDIIVREHDNNIIDGSRDLIRELETKNLKPIDKVYVPGFYGDNKVFLKELEDLIHISVCKLDESIYNKDNYEKEIINEEIEDDYNYILTNDNNDKVDSIGDYEEKNNNEEDDSLNSEVNSSQYMFAINSVVNKNKTINFSTKTINFNFNNILLSAAITILVVNIGVNLVANKYDKLINKVEIANNDVQHNIEILESEISTLNSDMLIYNETIKKVDAIQSQKHWLSDMLYTIEKNIPKEVTLANVDIMEGKTIVKGYAKDYRDVAYFAIALEKYGDVEIDQLSTAGTDARLNGRKLVKAFTIRLDHQGVVVNQETKN